MYLAGHDGGDGDENTTVGASCRAQALGRTSVSSSTHQSGAGLLGSTLDLLLKPKPSSFG